MPVLQPGEEITLSGRTGDGAFKMFVSLTDYIDGASLTDYAKKMSYEDPLAGGAVGITFRLEEYEGTGTVDPTEVYLFTFTGETEYNGWLTSTALFDMLDVFKPVAVGESTSGWVYFDQGKNLPDALRLDFINAEADNVSVLFTLPEPAALPGPEEEALAFNTPVAGDGVDFTVTKMENADRVTSVMSGMEYQALDGNEFAILKTRFANTGTQALTADALNLYFATDGGESYTDGPILMQDGAKLDYFSSLDPGKTVNLYFTAPMPKGTEGSGKFVLSIKDKTYAIPYTLRQTQNAGGALSVDQPISTASEEFTLKNLTRSTKMNPPKTGGDYTYVEVDQAGYTLLILSGTFKNNSDAPVEVKNRIGVSAEYNEELFAGFARLLSENRRGFDTVTTVQPGEEREVYFALSIPEEAAAADLTLTLETAENTYLISGIPD